MGSPLTIVPSVLQRSRTRYPPSCFSIAKWLRDSVNGAVSFSSRSGCHGGSHSLAVGRRPTMNGRSPSPSGAQTCCCNLELLAARYGLVANDSAVSLSAFLQLL